MIKAVNISKRFNFINGSSHWVFKNINLEINKHDRIGIIGKNGSGKSTLLRILSGSDSPTQGSVTSSMNVSWPMGFGGGLQGSLTGRQNAKFVARIHNHPSIEVMAEEVNEFAELGDFFNRPVNTYSSGMRSRLQFGLSLALDFDMYISDEVTATGDASFKAKARNAFKNKVKDSGLLMVSHSEPTLKDFCDQGIFLDAGNALIFKNIDDALYAYKESIEG